MAHSTSKLSHPAMAGAKKIKAPKKCIEKREGLSSSSSSALCPMEGVIGPSFFEGREKVAQQPCLSALSPRGKKDGFIKKCTGVSSFLYLPQFEKKSKYLPLRLSFVLVLLIAKLKEKLKKTCGFSFLEKEFVSSNPWNRAQSRTTTTTTDSSQEEEEAGGRSESDTGTYSIFHFPPLGKRVSRRKKKVDILS